MEKLRAFVAPYDDYEAVFDFEHIWKSGLKCCNGVRWKASVQRWEAFLLANISRVYRELKECVFQKHSGKFFCFDLVERGHLRHIRSLKIEERTAQKTLCDYALVPVLSHSFIYDNGATMKGKGISFAEKRLAKHLRKFLYRMTPEKALKEGCVVLFDFHHYFDSADHDVLKRIVERIFKDRKLIDTVKKFIDDFGDIGLGLGSQISQVLALTLANELDHAIKDKLGMKYYGRYMDDGYVFCESKAQAKTVVEMIRTMCSKLRIIVNEKKTRIVRLSRGFKFLKVLYSVTETGHIVRRTNHEGIKRMRQKLRKLRRRYDAGKIPLVNVEMALEAWFAHANRADSYHARRNMLLRFHRLFPESTAFYRRKTNREVEIEKAVIFVNEWKASHNCTNRRWSTIHMKRDWKRLKEKEKDNGVLQISFRRCCA